MERYQKILKRKKYFTAIFLCCFIQAVAAISEVLLFEKLIDRASWKNKDFVGIIYLTAVLAVFYIWGYLREPVMQFCREKLTIDMETLIGKDVFRKLTRISYQCFEKEEVQKLIETVYQNPGEHLVNYYEMLFLMGSGFLSSAGVLFFIARGGILYVLGVLLLLAVMILLFRYCSRVNIELFDIRRKLTGKEEYLSSLLFDRETAMERKLFSSADFIQDKAEQETKVTTVKMRRSLLKKNVVNLLYQFSNYFFAISAYIFLLKPLTEKKITLGLYIALIPALMKVGSFFAGLLENNLANIKTEKYFFEEFRKFEGLEEEFYTYKKEDAGKTFQKIIFKNVSFSYEDKLILNNLNLTIEQGKNYALVGRNGAGKSTFIKLLLGLYHPDSGEIYIDDKNYKELSFGEKTSYFAAVFQDYGKYELSVKDNILLGREEDVCLMEICHASGLAGELGKMPEGLHTFLGKLKEGGVDLSGGQWQKITIARMLYERKPCFIMDEPTAALDPVAESEFYERCTENIGRESASVFISHRLGSTALADEIIVLDQGQVIEKGTHRQLMEKEGVYKQMFETQRGYYA